MWEKTPYTFWNCDFIKMIWSWKEFWSYFDSVSDYYKTLTLQELNKDNWLADLAPDVQIEVLKHAPDEILNNLRHFPEIFKLETIKEFTK